MSVPAIKEYTLDALNASSEHLKKCSALELEKLKIVNGFHISDTILKAFLHPPLKELNLRYCANITNDGLRALSGCSITRLEINNCYHITADVLRFIKDLPIRELILPNVQLADKHLRHLVNVPLETVEICYTSVITREGMMQLAHLPLKSFTLRGVHQIKEVDLTSLYKRLKSA